MSHFDDIITVGFDKNGEADFRIKATIADLSLERMTELRSMIPVAIGSAEDMWRRNRSHRDHQPECALKARS